MFGAAPAASAATITTLHDFAPYPDGASFDSGLVQGTDGNFYGIAKRGGAFAAGAFFQVTPGGNYQVLHSFTADYNSLIGGPLTQASDGRFYGVTLPGGSAYPRLYSIGTDGSFLVLHTFDGADGFNWPSSELTYFNHYLYGVSEDGVIYRASLTGSIYKLHTLDYATEGSEPVKFTVGADNALYTVCTYDGPGSRGTVLKMLLNGKVTVLHTFTSADAGHLPTQLAAGPDGNLWGVFEFGGVQDAGVIYKISLAGDFTEVTRDVTSLGFIIGGPLVTKGDNLYGEIQENSGGFGRIFKITTDGTISTIYDLDGQPANAPMGGLTLGKDGSLYGTSSFEKDNTAIGQSGIAATVFKLTSAGAFTVLHAAPIADGSTAPQAIVTTGDGNAYGVTKFGGKYDFGMLYRISSTGVLTDIYDFGQADAYPTSLVMGPGGLLYGRTAYTIFRSIPGGQPSILHQFTGIQPFDPRLTNGGNGFIYGVSTEGVFRINSAGTYTLFGPFSFNSNSEQVTLAKDGCVYGINYSQLYKVSKTGDVTVVGNLPNVSLAAQSLTVGPDGKIYGVCSNAIDGIFVYNPAAPSPNLPIYRFHGGTDGTYGTSFLTLGPDGMLYGTATNGTDSGEVYRFNPATKQFTDLCPAPGSEPPIFNAINAAISMSFTPTGDLFGVVPYGGAHNAGQVFQVTSPLTP